MKRHSRTIILALAAVALGASLGSIYVHYRLLTDPGYASFCDVNETVSCAAVYQSAYGTFYGVPVAAGGAIWSGLVILAALGMGKPQSPAHAGVGAYVFVLATIGLAAVLYFGYVSFFILDHLCLLCATVYISVIGIFIVSGATSSAVSSLPSRVGRDLESLRGSPVALGLAALWLVGSVSLIAFFPRETAVEGPSPTAALASSVPVETLTAEEIAEFEKWLAVQPRESLDVPADGARVVVVKFNDYQCPACRQTYIAYKSVRQKYEASHAGDVRFVTVDFPLEAECNTGGVHAAACEAAAAVRMAKAKNRGEAMEEWLFDRQAEMTPALVKEGLREVAQVTDFDAQYPGMVAQIREDAQLGNRIKISGTPTFFINGIRIGGSLRTAYFDAAIAYELKRTEAPTP